MVTYTIGDPWMTWASATTSTSTTTTWITWASSSTATTADTWYSWNTGVLSTLPRVQPARQETDEEREAREQAWREQEARARQVREQAQREHRAARRRARTLLRSCLDRAQKRTLKQHGYFDVRSIGQDGTERTYRIFQGTHGNVREIDAEGREIRKFCIQPNGVPDEDAMLAQKLWIEHDLASFERVANITPFRRVA